MITIGDNVIISTDSIILAHDASLKNVLGISKVAPVTIEDNVFIGSGCIVLCGVSIGKNSIIGAGSVVTKDVPPNEIWAGNPAKKIGDVDNYKEKHKKISVGKLKTYPEIITNGMKGLCYQKCINFEDKYKD